MDSNNQVIRWMNDAYAIEMALIPMLEDHAKQAKGNELIESTMKSHIERSKKHAELIKERILTLGGDVSDVKTIVSGLLENVSDTMNSIFTDKNIKNTITDFAIENYEISFYTALRNAAEYIGDSAIQEICDLIIADEVEMATFLHSNLPLLVKSFLNKNEN